MLPIKVLFVFSSLLKFLDILMVLHLKNYFFPLFSYYSFLFVFGKNFISPLQNLNPILSCLFFVIHTMLLIMASLVCVKRLFSFFDLILNIVV